MDRSELLACVANNLKVSVVTDADTCTRGKCDAFFEDGTVVLSVNDPDLLVHELVHVIQSMTKSFCFSFSELVVYSLSKGIPLDREFASAFLPFWRESVAGGAYESWELPIELPAHYCQFAQGGWELFLCICQDAGVI